MYATEDSVLRLETSYQYAQIPLICGHSCKNWVKFRLLITPHACTRGKAINFVCHCLSSVVSRDLGIWATCKHNESVEISEKLASVCFDSFGTAHERHKKCVFVSHAYWPHLLGLLQAMCFLLMCTTHLAYVGKGCQQTHTCTCRSMLLLQLSDTCRCNARGMCSGELNHMLMFVIFF